MKALSRLQSIVFAAGALLMLAGAIMGMMAPQVAPWIFAIGALSYTAMQLQQRYQGDNITIRRLSRIMLLSDVLLIGVAAMMFADYRNPFQLEYLTWLRYIHNNWVVVLLLAAIIQLYTVYRIDAELRKEAKKP
jgi:hypothetical protein